ncbi:hypothetical protein K435DRAFT_810413 [Dendrothele bispora CBS 962.96]|uniref:Zn(2)-C6 fungal-type domain-containing protein n=1 Tax=Dendrothele bispora (strain CBS 962.96) TaxID=1314807 RepID=A0A4V4HBK2_DENBC|nr:hypothetical protein K435DRAFT_810413 [Dendrothele bispora CBS 962.96]
MVAHDDSNGLLTSKSQSPRSQNDGLSPSSDTQNSQNSANGHTNPNSTSGQVPHQQTEKRVSLACHRCRIKRGRCSGDKPTCQACLKAGEECSWPDGRKRKRTRREMEADERMERERQARSQAMSVGIGNGSVIARDSGLPGVVNGMVDGEMGGLRNISPTVGSAGVWHPNQNSVPATNGNLTNTIHSWQYPVPSYIWPPVSASTMPSPSHSGQPHSIQTSSHHPPQHGPRHLQHTSNSNMMNPSVSSVHSDSLNQDINSNGSVLTNGSSSTSFDSRGGDGSHFDTFNTCQYFPTAGSLGNLGTSEQIVQALEGNVAFIDGDPSRQEELELYYYRFSGSTAIHPGINRISLKLHPRTRSNGGRNRSPIAAAPVPSSELNHSDIVKSSSSPGSLASPLTQSSPTSKNSRNSSAVQRPISNSDDYEKLFDDSGFPLPSVYRPLLDTFFRTLGRHFPSVSRKRMEERLETGTMSAFLLNCICALAARFHSPSSSIHSSSSQPFPSFSNSDCPPKACAPFITKAQELIIPLLHLPAHDSVTGLLLLAWANFGMNSESGLWQYTGIAIRMAIDMGLHEISEIYESPAHVVRTRLLFWSLFITDRIIAFSTGRPVSISEEIIEIPLPSDQDLTPDPAEMPPTVRLMVLCGRIANVLNGRRGRTRTLVGPYQGFSAGVAADASGNGAGVDVLAELQTQLVQYYADLPEEMKWTVDAFRCQEARGHGGVFLTLHLWANAVLALVYHPDLLTNPNGTETPMTSRMDRSLKLSLASSRLINECLVFADLFASQSYLASPFVVQPIYVASLAFAYDIRLSMLGMDLDQQQAPNSHSSVPSLQSQSPSETPRTADFLLTSLARQNLSVFVRALQRMEHYWAGVSYVSNLLEVKMKDLIPGDTGLFGNVNGKKKNKMRTFISLPDKGLLRRFTDPNLPHNTAPPTETSLRTSVLKEAQYKQGNSPGSVSSSGGSAANSGHTPGSNHHQSQSGLTPNSSDMQHANTCSLDDILSMYSVHDMFVQPVPASNSFDLQTLLGATASFDPHGLGLGSEIGGSRYEIGG